MTVIEVPSHREVLPGRLLWEEETAGLCVIAPSLPPSARRLLRAALDSMLSEPGFDPTWEPAAWPLLAALEPTRTRRGRVVRNRTELLSWLPDAGDAARAKTKGKAPVGTGGLKAARQTADKHDDGCRLPATAAF